MKMKTVNGALLSLALLASSVGNSVACTVLAMRDANGNVYQARSNEFVGQQPDALSYYPPGTRIESVTPDGKQGKTFNTKYAIFGATLKGMTPNAKQETIHEAVNDQGMSLTTNAFMGNTSPTPTAPTEKILSALDLGTWALGNFQNVQQVKQALDNKEVEVWLPRVPSMANLYAPLHFAMYDKAGGSIVIEFTDGKTSVYDNPTAVMTNDPPFPWHLKNMNNYAYLTNIDKNTGQFNALKVASTDSGGNMANLPSAGRFVKAAYYSNFAHKASTPDQAVKTLSHVMNDFDRPKDISADLPGTASKAEAFAASKISSESTYFTTMNDLNRGHFYLRTIDSINFAKFDVRKLAAVKQTKVITFSAINTYENLDTTALFLK